MVGLMSGWDQPRFVQNNFFINVYKTTGLDYKHGSFSLMIAKYGVVFPSKPFVALKLGGMFSNTVNYSVRAALYMV